MSCSTGRLQSQNKPKGRVLWGRKPGRGNPQHSDGEGSTRHPGSAVATGSAVVATLGTGTCMAGAANPERNGLLSQGEADTALH